MSVRFAVNYARNPEEFNRKAFNYVNKNQTWLGPAVLGSGAVGLGTMGIGAAASLNPENEALNKAAQVSNWVINPLIDSGAEYINNQINGLNRRTAAALAGGSGAGMFAGQLLAANLFKNKEGESNQFAIGVGGLAGDIIGDFGSELLINKTPILKRVLKLV